MDTEPLPNRTTSLADVENWLALGTGAVLLLVGASRRSAVGALMAASSARLLYRGITGRWPAVVNGIGQAGNTKTALSGARGVHVRESIRLEVPLAKTYEFWRRLEKSRGVYSAGNGRSLPGSLRRSEGNAATTDLDT